MPSRGAPGARPSGYVGTLLDAARSATGTKAASAVWASTLQTVARGSTDLGTSSLRDAAAACEVWASVSKATTSTPLATPCMCNAVFVELAQYATTESAAGALLSALLAVMRTVPEGAVGALFGTASMRDRVFVPIAPLVTSTHVLPFWEAVAGICKDGEARRLFTTPGIRHCFFQLAKRVVTADAADWCARALCSITQPAEGAALFAIGQTVGLLHRLSKYAATRRVNVNICTAVHNLFHSNPGARWAATPAIVNVFIRLAEHAVGEGVQKLFASLGTLLQLTEARALFTTVGVRDHVFLRLADRCSSDDTAWEFFAALTNLCRDNPGASAVFATPAVRDMVFMSAAGGVSSDDVTEQVFASLGYLLFNTEDEKAHAVFATEAVRDELFLRLAKRAESSGAVSILWAVSVISESESARNLFATPAVRDEVVLPLAGRVHDSEGAFFCLGAIAHLISGDDEGTAARRAVFSTPAMSDVSVELAEYATTPRAASMLVWLCSHVCSCHADEPADAQSTEPAAAASEQSDATLTARPALTTAVLWSRRTLEGRLRAAEAECAALRAEVQLLRAAHGHAG